MQHTKAQLTALAYTIFPRGLYDGSKDYYESAAHKNLLRYLENKSMASLLLDKIGLDIAAVNPKFGFENMSIILKYDRCAKGRFFSESSSFLIYVSLVIPYYVSYRQSWTYLPKNGKDLNDYGFFMAELTEEHQCVEKQICLYVEAEFPGYKRFATELLNAEVNDIILDGSGTLQTFPNSACLNPMTFFNVFFSGVYF